MGQSNGFLFLRREANIMCGSRIVVNSSLTREALVSSQHLSKRTCFLQSLPQQGQVPLSKQIQAEALVCAATVDYFKSVFL